MRRVGQPRGVPWGTEGAWAGRTVATLSAEAASTGCPPLVCISPRDELTGGGGITGAVADASRHPPRLLPRPSVIA